MITMTPEKLVKGEPVQRSLEYLDQSLDFILDKNIEKDYKLKIIFSSGKRLADEYLHLVKKNTVKYRGIMVADDWLAGKLMVLRLLVKATPCPAQLQIHPENKVIFHYLYNLRFMRELLSQITPLDHNRLIPKEFIQASLLKAEVRGFNLNCLSMNGYPLLICSLPYQGNKGAYYLPSFHTVIIFASPYPEDIKQFIIFHELGHALYHLNNQKHWKQKLPGREFQNLLELLKFKYPPPKITVLKPLKERHLDEAFASLLASYLLGTWEKDSPGEEVIKLLKEYLESLRKYPSG
ncbi:MAG: hypothetical protein D5R97_05720 [Candidatus Syntrophonatronum acetioxidans]|uniref:Uncharacterized protein n=1 Tax=Candidatus Syntrophonatronum acetioxidans TaxID=1795816 RepID=A0A424YDY7_9FIRM|nr:MAG: hypothetical protein D5R97_05720 [Candidatus Syntrophonatronum acetioxidans]